MKKSKKDSRNEVFKAYTFILQFTINMLVPIAAMTAVGYLLDKKFGTSFWVVVLFFVGAIAGGQNIYKMAKSLFPDKKPDYEKELLEYKEQKEANSLDKGNES